MLVAAIAVAVFQQSDTTGDRPGRIIGHLSDEQSAIGVPGQRDWRDHVRLGGDEFGGEVGISEMERGQFFRW